MEGSKTVKAARTATQHRVWAHCSCCKNCMILLGLIPDPEVAANRHTYNPLKTRVPKLVTGGEEWSYRPTRGRDASVEEERVKATSIVEVITHSAGLSM